MEQPDNAVLLEIQELKAILSVVIGSADRVGEDRFSAEAVSQAAKFFQRMSIERGDWVEGVIKPQLVKGRTKAMYLESEVLKIQKKKKPTEPDRPLP